MYHLKYYLMYHVKKKLQQYNSIYIYISNHNFHKLIISPPSPAAQPRSGKFSCAWAPRDSLRASAAYISWAASAMRSFLVEPWQQNSGVHVILIPVIPMGPLGLWQWNIPIGSSPEAFPPPGWLGFRAPKSQWDPCSSGRDFELSELGKKYVPVAGHRTKKWPKHQMFVIIITIYYYKWLYNSYNQFMSSSNCESDSFCGTGWVCSMPHLPCACSYCTTRPTRPTATETETQLASWSDWPSVEALDASNIISKRCHHVKVGFSSHELFKLLITHLIHQPVF